MAKGMKTGGRTKGTPNKVNQEFRETIAKLLDDNAKNVSIWLSKVAEGDMANDIKPDPAKALDLMSKLAEYAAPKLSRTEVANPDGESFRTDSKWTVEFVNATPKDQS